LFLAKISPFFYNGIGEKRYLARVNSSKFAIKKNLFRVKFRQIFDMKKKKNMAGKHPQEDLAKFGYK
jgi:hypothetical protein